MNVSNISAVTTLPGSQSTANVLAPSSSSSETFLRLIDNQLRQVSEQQQVADTRVEQLVQGNTDNIHQVVVDMAKADLMFRMVLEVRNRLMDSYQELMRMQV